MGYTSMGLTPSASAKARARRQADALAELAVDEAEKRLVLDWDAPLRHPTFYKAVYRPAVLRANREAGATVLPPELKFHALRHTYASLCVAAGIKPAKLSGRMGHAKVRTTLDVYVARGFTLTEGLSAGTHWSSVFDT